ncbi:MAG: type IV secretory system conjugative DNA transfer family protein [Candidatus Omnitrophota bacterium]
MLNLLGSEKMAKMLTSFLERLAIKVFEAGQKKLASSDCQKIVPPSSLYIGRSPKPYSPREEENVFLSQSEGEGHSYILGGTGTGKTTFIENRIRHDILQNKGWCLLDAHGDLSEKLIRFLATLWQYKEGKQKEEMARRLLLVEPFHDRITGFNPLEASLGDSVYPCALEMMGVFKKRWPDFGPRMDELFRTCLVTLGENKLTLLEMPLLLTNKEARCALVGNLTNQEIKAYWLDRYNKLSQGSEVQYREPVLNKVTEFLTDENIRFILGQARSTLDFRRAMDEGKWIILNISKGRLKSNALLLGGLFLMKLQLAVLSRANISSYQRRPFYTYLDEFQNFINARESGDVETLLSESRKYNLYLTMAHQNLAQLDSSLLNAIFGNITALLCFRLGYKDALTLAPELSPADKKVLGDNLIKLRVGEAYLKIKGKPARLVKIPFPVTPNVHPKVVEEFKKYSLSFSTRPLLEVKKEIEERHRKLQTKKTASSCSPNRNNPMEGQNGW